MDILAQLTAEHRQLLILMGQIDSLLLGEDRLYRREVYCPKTSRQVQSLLQSLVPAIRRHEKLEREQLFPALLRDVPELKRRIEEMREEHRALGDILGEFSETMDRKDQVSCQIILDHITRLMRQMQIHMMREELEVFKPARERLSRYIESAC